MKKLALMIAIMLWPVCVLGQTGAVQGHCFQGGTRAATSGMNSSNYLQGIIPACSVTVYLHGTITTAVIYADSSNTPLANPFTANVATGVDPGGWIFYASSTSAVDVFGSGGQSNPSCTTAPLCYASVTPLVLNTLPGAASGGPYCLLSGCTMTGPQPLNLPELEGTIFADQKQTPPNAGNNGIFNALTNCTGACVVAAPPIYANVENQPFGGVQNWLGSSTLFHPYGATSSQPASTAFEDFREGVFQWIFNDPLSDPSGNGASPSIAVQSTFSNVQNSWGSSALNLNCTTFYGGRNMPNLNVSGGGGDKINYNCFRLNSYKYTSAQDGGNLIAYINDFTGGDENGLNIEMQVYGGQPTLSDEVHELLRLNIDTQGMEYAGTIVTSTVDANGSHILTLNNEVHPGTTGEDRLATDYSLPINAGYVSGVLTGAATSDNTIQATIVGGSIAGTYGVTTQTLLTSNITNPGQIDVTTATPTVLGGVLTALACSGGTTFSSTPPFVIFANAGNPSVLPTAVATVSGGAVTGCTITQPGAGISSALTATLSPSNSFPQYNVTVPVSSSTGFTAVLRLRFRIR